MANIDTLTGKILNVNLDEVEHSLDEGHLFDYAINRFRDEKGNEYKIMTTITIAQYREDEDKPFLKI